jgi:hypothetical protein
MYTQNGGGEGDADAFSHRHRRHIEWRWGAVESRRRMECAGAYRLRSTWLTPRRHESVEPWFLLNIIRRQWRDLAGLRRMESTERLAVFNGTTIFLLLRKSFPDSFIIKD